MAEQIKYDQAFDRARKEESEDGLEAKRPDGYIKEEDIPSDGRTPEEEMIAKEEEEDD